MWKRSTGTLLLLFFLSFPKGNLLLLFFLSFPEGICCWSPLYRGFLERPLPSASLVLSSVQWRCASTENKQKRLPANRAARELT